MPRFLLLITAAGLWILHACHVKPGWVTFDWLGAAMLVLAYAIGVAWPWVRAK